MASYLNTFKYLQKKFDMAADMAHRVLHGFIDNRGWKESPDLIKLDEAHGGKVRKVHPDGMLSSVLLHYSPYKGQPARALYSHGKTADPVPVPLKRNQVIWEMPEIHGYITDVTHGCGGTACVPQALWVAHGGAKLFPEVVRDLQRVHAGREGRRIEPLDFTPVKTMEAYLRKHGFSSNVADPDTGQFWGVSQNDLYTTPFANSIFRFHLTGNSKHLTALHDWKAVESKMGNHVAFHSGPIGKPDAHWVPPPITQVFTPPNDRAAAFEKGERFVQGFANFDEFLASGLDLKSQFDKGMHK